LVEVEQLLSDYLLHKHKVAEIAAAEGNIRNSV
jgi:hypothetical protein